MESSAIKHKFLFFIFLIILFSPFISLQLIKAEEDSPLEKYENLKTQLTLLDKEIEKCEDLSGREKIDCIDKVMKKIQETKKELDLYAKEIGERAEKLKKDVKSLKNQIGYLEAEVEKTQIQMRVIEGQINYLNLSISKTKEEIKNAQKEIEKIELEIKDAKEKLAENIKLIYEYDSQGILELTFGKGKLSSFFEELVYIERIQKEIRKNLLELREQKKEVQERKEKLKKQKSFLERQKEEVSRKIQELQATIGELEATKRQKSILLEITQGDEKRYRQILAEIERQKRELLGDLSALSRARAQEIAKLIEETGGRLCGYFGVPYFAQDAGYWRNYNIGGFPDVPMWRWGCAVTSVAMVFKYYGINTDPGKLSQEKIYVCSGGDCGLIVWPSVWPPENPKVKLVLNTAHGGVDWTRIDQELEAGHPVILNIVIPGRGQHYVVVVGKTSQGYIVNDPLSSVGCGVNLKVSVENIEKIYGAKATHDQMIIYHPY